MAAQPAPQLCESFWTVGASSAAEPDEFSLLRDAKRGLALEMMRITALAPPGTTRPPIKPEDRTKVAVEPMAAQKIIQRALGTFERSALTSEQPWTVSETPQVRAVANAFDGTPMERTHWFQLARQTFRPACEFDNRPLQSDDSDEMVVDFAEFMQSINGKEVDVHAYGKGEGAVELAVQAMEAYVRGAELTKHLIKLTRPALFVSFAEPFIASMAEAEAGIERMLDQSPFARENLLERASTLKRAHDLFASLRKLANQQIAERNKKPSLLFGMEDDCFEIMTRHLNSKSAIALIRSCKTFRDSKALAMRIPHMHIRMVPGCFPHAISSSLDREDLKNNQKRLVTRNFVVKKRTVSLYVDFVRPTFRATPLKKKPRKDGLDNLLHDFSDDEFEEEPESPNRSRPVVGEHNLSTDYGMRMHKLETRRQKDWDEAEGPREKVDRWMFNDRICQEIYFENPLDMTVSLVFADTLEPATHPGFPSGIDPSNRYVANGNKFRKPYRIFDREMPGQCKFHVPLLTSDHAGRRFRLKLTGRSTRRGTSEPVKLVSYSDPFEVVSDLATISRANKRRTKAETSEYARERENKKQRAAAARRAAEAPAEPAQPTQPTPPAETR